ncbi:Cytoplasmic dynein 2 heavy chain 1, partial [Blyttiomyces sp. JEL0837]
NQFIYGLIRGLGANLVFENRMAFANELLQWSGERCPDNKRILDFYFADGRLQMYDLEEPEKMDVQHIIENDIFPVIETIDVKRAVDTIMPWLENGYPFLLVGPEGVGKHMLLRHCFKKLRSTSFATIHCSAQTRSSHLLQRLSHMCISVSTNTGRTLRPKDSEKLIIYLKDINLPKPDQYETVELIQFMQQLITYKGYYDSSLEWIGIENIQIVASMNPSTAMGRNKLSTRFTSIVRQCCVAYPEKDQLQTIYRILCQPILAYCFPSHAVWDLPKNIQRLSSTLIAVYDQVSQKFNVDVYPHYLFTPRDISRWIIGLTRYEYKSREESELLDILAYEATRIFQDRLVTTEHRTKFLSILSSCLTSDWNHQAKFPDKIFACGSSVTKNGMKVRKLFETDMKNYANMFEKEIHVFERDYRDLNISIFPEVLENVSKIERVLSQPGGSIMLVGRPGVGRRSGTQIVAHILKMKVVTPNITRNYNLKAFSLLIKEVMQTAGALNEEVLLLLEDYQLTDATFLEYVNSLLSGSEVPGLYAPEELDALLSSIKDQHSQEGFRGTLFEFFVLRVRKNLHIALIIDSSSKSFTANCEANPALYTRCHIQWMDSWSKESAEFLCKSFFGKSEELAAIPDSQELIKIMLSIHDNCAQGLGATPSHLVEYAKTYESVYCTNLKVYHDKIKYLSGGLRKLQEASKFVDTLSEDAKKQGIQLAEKQKQADIALRQITDSIAKASDQKKEMEVLSSQLREEEEKTVQRKHAIEAELAEVEPIVRAAKSAVGEIKNESLTEIRSLRAPPPAVRDVLEGVLRLMGTLDMSWNSMKGFLGKRTVKDEIMNFDARNITEQVRESVTSLLKAKKESFEEAVIKRVSVAAAPLAMWVKANLQYSAVLVRINPLEADLLRLTRSLDSSKERINQLKESLSMVDRNVQALRDDFGNKTRDAETLRANLEKASETIHQSQGLLEKLSGEGKRWQSQARAMKESIADLPKNALLSAAFITYLGGASEDIRSKYKGEWKKIASLSDFDFCKVMSSESEMLQWKSQGLPSDLLSAENAISILNSIPTTILVDPSSQATSWLKSHLSTKKPDVVKQHGDNFLRSLELALRFGKTLIVEDMDKLEPILYPILRKDLLKQGPRYMVQLGDKTVDYNENFQLYLVTSRATFSIPPDAAGLLNEINFTITRAGLAGQLLGITLKNEKPELEIEKVKLLQKEDQLKMQLSALEESLLKELASSDGNILENKTLIASLNETNAKSLSISSSLKESIKLQAALDNEREKFSPLSQFGSKLFFVVNDLAKINSMYQFSLASFLRLFEQALRFEGSTSEDGTDLRIKLLIGALEKITFRYISRSLFKNDRQMFSLHLIHQMHENLFEPKEWNLFSGQILVPDLEETKDSDCPRWVPSDRRAAFKQIQVVTPALYNGLNVQDSDSWIHWIKSSNCEQGFPSTITLRPDRLLSSMNSFACGILGLNDLAPPPFNIKKIYEEETIPTEPILFITTPGADPSQELRDLAKEEVGLDNFRQISMGQGQGDFAIAEVKRLGSSGGWLCLQNVHLVITWLSDLEKTLLSLSNPHPKFRLWLTSEAHPRFPSSLLQNCLKVTSEAPPGLKKNLQRIYEGWSPEFIASGSALRAQALFALAWFHAVIQERRSYIPQGWNKFYEFSAADLRSTADVLTEMCESNKSPQWTILHGLIENAIYGGRIDDIYDAMKLKSYLRLYFNEEVFSTNGRNPTKKLSKGINLPSLPDHPAFVETIVEIPESDTIAMYGLPANIDRAQQINTSKFVIDQLKTLRNLGMHASKFDKEKWSRELMPFLQLWKKLNTGNDLLQRKLSVSSETDPILSFFSLELTHGITLIRKIHADLSYISKVLRGTALMSTEVISTAQSLMKGETPANWLSIWDGPTENPQTYLKDAVSNTLTVDSLKQKAVNSSLFSSNSGIQLSSLLNPVTFLNALRQQTSRK